ncbi:MAG: sugar phosphate isomerase/epimerase [Clostridium sp.]|nr:sugar phosphate isomerase/epimerase [Clostridium sp.]
MRFGCCLNMVSSEADGTGIEAINALAKAGYDYAELPLAEMTALADREFRSLEEQVRRSGISCEVCNNFFPGSIRLTGEDARLDTALRYADKALRRAHILGAEIVVFGSGQAKNVPSGYPADKGYSQVVQLLKKINVCAGEQNITVVIEPLRRAECNLINTFAEGCRLADDVQGENIKVLADYYHMTEEKEPLSHIARGGEYLRHVHFANPSGRVYPEIADGGDYAGFFKALKDCGYNGRISCEAYTEDFEKSAEKALDLFRQMTK